jgi:hypothetical protein
MHVLNYTFELYSTRSSSSFLWTVTEDVLYGPKEAADWFIDWYCSKFECCDIQFVILHSSHHVVQHVALALDLGSLAQKYLCPMQIFLDVFCLLFLTSDKLKNFVDVGKPAPTMVQSPHAASLPALTCHPAIHVAHCAL